MKNLLNHRKKAAGLLVGAVLASSLTVLAVPITFQVNMSAEANFTNGVHPVTIRGTFNNWGNAPSVPWVLTNNVADTNIFEGTFEVPGSAGANVNYKFVYGASSWESISDRLFRLPASATTLPTCWYNNNAAGNISANVTFLVNMSSQIGSGQFTPGVDLLEVRGGFNGWSSGSALSPTVADTNIYELTTPVTMASGATVFYKFTKNVGGTVTWETLAGYGNPDNNRSFLMQTADQTNATVYFADVAGYPIKAAAYFQVDLSAQILIGSLDTNHQVWVRGTEVLWGDPPEGFQLFADGARPGLYTNTWTKTNMVTGAIFEYKYVIFNTNDATEVWEGGGNKTVSWNGSEPVNPDGFRQVTIGPTYFDGLQPGDYLAADTLVTFRVDMSSAVRYPSSLQFDPANEGVWINGDMLTNGWNTYGFWGVKPPETRMFDDGSNGDAVAGDKIYSWQTTLKKGTRTRAFYKYGIESEDNEAPSQQDHSRYVRSTGTYLMPIDKFGTQYQEPSFGELKIAKGAAGYVDLTWLGGGTVRLRSSSSPAGPWTDVPGTLGANSASVASSGAPQYFRLFKP